MVVICTVGASYGKVPTVDLGGALQLASGIQEPKPECFSKGELAFPGNAQVLRLSVCQTDPQGAPQGGTCPCWCWSTAREILPVVPTGCGGVPLCAVREGNLPVRQKEQL